MVRLVAAIPPGARAPTAAFFGAAAEALEARTEIHQVTLEVRQITNKQLSNVAGLRQVIGALVDAGAGDQAVADQVAALGFGAEAIAYFTRQARRQAKAAAVKARDAEAVKLAETMTMTEAAARLGVNRATVSRAIKSAASR